MTIRSVFIGVFPPPMGGVTVKNQLLLDELSKNHGMKKIDLHAKPIALQFIKAYFEALRSNNIIIGLDTKRLKVVIALISLIPGALSKCRVFIMGGIANRIIEEDKALKRALKKTKKMYVETTGMLDSFVNCGFENVDMFPNCKSEVNALNPIISKKTDPIRLLFFSRICKEKGISFVMDSVKELDKKGINFSIDFFGPISSDIEDDFYRFIDAYSQVTYCGIFNTVNDNVYKKMNDYDILMFPTVWKAEGVPGCLVEAKMSGITVIASNCCHNAEIIRQQENEGIIVNDDYSLEITEAVSYLSNDRALLNLMKRKSFESRLRYSVEHYQNVFDECIYS